jgi:hypothetical protein
MKPKTTANGSNETIAITILIHTASSACIGFVNAEEILPPK